MRSFQLGMYDNMIRNVVGNYSGYVQVHTQGYWEEQGINNSMENSEELASTIKSVPGVVDIVPRLSSFSLASSSDLTKGLSITGIDLEKENLMKPIADRLIEGKVFSNDKEVIIGKKVAEYFHSTIGDTIVFIGQGYHGSNAAGKFVISGIIDLKNPILNQSSTFMDLKGLQNYLDAPNLISQLIVVKKDNYNETALAQSISQNLDLEKYEVMDWHEMQPEIDQTILIDSIGGIIMVSILYMIITFGIFGTVLMMIQERMYEMGILVSIGMKKVKLSLIIFFETIFLSIIGVLAGMVAIFPFVLHFRDNPIDVSNGGSNGIEEFGFEPLIPTLVDPSIFLTHGSIILVISIVITIYPFWVIRKLDPIEAMKS